MTIKEAAAAWGITERRVNALCKAGRISSAYKEGRQWFIPDSTQKPMDKRGHRSVVELVASSASRCPLAYLITGTPAKTTTMWTRP